MSGHAPSVVLLLRDPRPASLLIGGIAIFVFNSIKYSRDIRIILEIDLRTCDWVLAEFLLQAPRQQEDALHSKELPAHFANSRAHFRYKPPSRTIRRVHAA